jgi:predicted amino acid dehydrogenase
MKEIIAISFGPAKENFDETIELLGSTFRVKRLGVDFNFDLALDLVKKYRSQCDILAFSGFPVDVKINGRVHTHDQVLKLRKAAQDTPVADGANLKSLGLPFFIRNLALKEPFLFKGKRIAFFSGITQWDYIPAYAEITSDLVFADPYMAANVPKVIKGFENFKKFLTVFLPVMKKINLASLKEKDFRSKLTQLPTMKDFFDADIFVLNETQMDYIKLPDLSGKTVIIDQIDSFSKKMLEEANVEKVYSCFPDFIDMPQLGFNGLEAILMAHTGKNKLDQEDLLDIISAADLRPEVYVPKSQDTKNIEKFSFIIHPLGRSQLFQLPIIKPLLHTPAAPHIEDILAKAPGFYYGSISGIVSLATGKEVVGELWAVPMTPKVMLKQNPERMYQVLNKICDQAFKKGSKIIGLGAYTKIVGDAGVTVNDRSPIPVTTGNSLSATSTLWAAGFAIEKMGLLQKKKNQYQGTAMVVGATGSIGKVCARILATQWKRVVIAAPRPYKVLELVNELKALNPEIEILGTSSPDRYSGECDLIITSTSAQGEAVLDIMKVKPGCVICDVSRPFDISLDDACKRPDVLVIASGEVTLPGNIEISRTLNLPGKTVYACLAETALLAMEGRHESFSLSRELSYEKVIEIDQLARKHGVRLSAIMGHTGEITEEEINLCRAHALKALSSLKPEAHTSEPSPAGTKA